MSSSWYIYFLFCTPVLTKEQKDMDKHVRANSLLLGKHSKMLKPIHMNKILKSLKMLINQKDDLKGQKNFCVKHP